MDLPEPGRCRPDDPRAAPRERRRGRRARGRGALSMTAEGAAGASDDKVVEREATAVEAATGGETAAVEAAKRARRRRFGLTTDTAPPEGGGRAAPGDASAPARQWPLLSVLVLAGIGLVVVGVDAFPQSFRVGTMLVGAALLLGAVMRRVVPSVGMLAVRSRFTDMITYGVMGSLIVLLALMVQPHPWLRIPFLEDVLHLTL
ncbi:DUF3017 domain-containing protein [Streptomyces venezuelae]|nr:DUF3017 domain-containing protein [Streptomyces gardneri]WRK42093.1 DUF3017 domain-containing protein [Streptomyces venezuelae]